MPCALILLHMHCCGHCTEFMPTWDKIPDANIHKIKIEKDELFNDEKEKLLFRNTINEKRREINAYPTILFFDGENKFVEFKGQERSLDNLTNFYNKNKDETEKENKNRNKNSKMKGGRRKKNTIVIRKTHRSKKSTTKKRQHRLSVF